MEAEYKLKFQEIAIQSISKHFFVVEFLIEQKSEEEIQERSKLIEKDLENRRKSIEEELTRSKLEIESALCQQRDS